LFRSIATQAAVWILTDRVSYEHINEKFSTGLFDWNQAMDVVGVCRTKVQVQVNIAPAVSLADTSQRTQFYVPQSTLTLSPKPVFNECSGSSCAIWVSYLNSSQIESAIEMGSKQPGQSQGLALVDTGSQFAQSM